MAVTSGLLRVTSAWRSMAFSLGEVQAAMQTLSEHKWCVSLYIANLKRWIILLFMRYDSICQAAGNP